MPKFSKIRQIEKNLWMKTLCHVTYFKNCTFLESSCWAVNFLKVYMRTSHPYLRIRQRQCRGDSLMHYLSQGILYLTCHLVHTSVAEVIRAQYERTWPPRRYAQGDSLGKGFIDLDNALTNHRDLGFGAFGDTEARSSFNVRLTCHWLCSN